MELELDLEMEVIIIPKRKIWACTHCDLEYDYEPVACDKCHCPLFTLTEIEEHEI